MWGAIFGDIVGSLYEFRSQPSENFPLLNPNAFFTDDTVLSIAVADYILTGTDITKVFQQYGRNYPNAGYGTRFCQWLWMDEPRPINSWGNGAAMRISPVGWAADNEQEVLSLARKITEVSHNHPEGIKGAQTTAMAVFLAKRANRRYRLKKNFDAMQISMEKEKEIIREKLENLFGYDLHTPLSERTLIPPDDFDGDSTAFPVSCQYSVPTAIRLFLESKDFTHAVRSAVLLGGDTDTMACITGSIAEAFYGIPADHVKYVQGKLPKDFIEIIEQFHLYCKTKHE